MTRESFIFLKGMRVRRRGIALMLVVMVMALAAILATALLSGSVLQATAASNGASAAIARAEAESGIHLAMYYLLNPNNAPTFTGTYWPGTGGSYITFATTEPSQTMAGSVSIAVSNISGEDYQVTSIGAYTPPSGTTPITKTITATVLVSESFQILEGGGFNSNVAVGSGVTFTGSSPANALSSSGTVDLTGGTINGNVSALSVVGGTINGETLPAPVTSPAPASGTVTDYSQPYTYEGHTYSPGVIPTQGAGLITIPTTLGVTASNPLGVYYYNATATGSLTVKSTLIINGTLVVKNGNLSAQSSNITITAQSSMPALVIDDSLQINGASRNMTINGVVYAGEGVTGVATNSTDNVAITGSLLASSGGITGYSGKMTVTYNSTYAGISNFTSSNETPTAVQVVSWSE